MHLHARLAVCALLFVGAACSTTIPIQSLQPGRVSLGASSELTLVKGEGRRSAREAIAQEVIRQARGNGYFTVQDHSEDPIFVRIHGGRVDVEDGEGLLTGTGVKIDVIDWDHDNATEEVQSRTADGTVVIEEFPVQVGEVLLAITLFDETGRAILSETEYSGQFATRDLRTPRDTVVEQAAAHAIAQLLDDITPRTVVTHVTLDDSDPGQEHIIATAQAGNVAQAAEDCRTYLRANPKSAPAAYNLAVFLDAMGRYEEAMTHYDQAMQLGSSGDYAKARAECARRLHAQTELSATPR